MLSLWFIDISVEICWGFHIYVASPIRLQPVENNRCNRKDHTHSADTHTHLRWIGKQRYRHRLLVTNKKNTSCSNKEKQQEYLLTSSQIMHNTLHITRNTLNITHYNNMYWWNYKTFFSVFHSLVLFICIVFHTHSCISGWSNVENSTWKAELGPVISKLLVRESQQEIA